MSLTLEQRIETFTLEWSMRELLMRAGDYSDEAISAHRQEILHRYALTEHDLKEMQ